MLEKIKNLFLENLGLKVTALVLAVLVWAAVTGRERADSEKTLRIPVELANVSESIEVRSVKPEGRDGKRLDCEGSRAHQEGAG